jgi:uncharacterized LabA/DUF88 family protein
MKRDRVIAFIDGFNLYHAIANLKRPYLKWLDLFLLSKQFVKSVSEELTKVLYFTALAEHLNESAQKRQQAYIRALEIKRVQPILGHFKNKDRRCPDCSYKWVGHEEKATDVNIALRLLDLAYRDEFDRAILITNDSDLAPAIELVRLRFPKKRVTTIVPPHRYHSNELIQASSDKSKIRIEHLERCLLPEKVLDASGLTAVQRPQEYDPVGAVLSHASY